MNLSKRELNLGVATLAVLLLGFLFVVGEGYWKTWKESHDEAGLLRQKLVRLERLYAQKDRLENEFSALIQILPSYPAAKDVTADNLREVQQLATQSRLTLRGLRPDKEQQIGALDLYEQSIKCEWLGSLEALVTFMAHLQARGAVMDLRSMNAAPVARKPGLLKGSFIVDTAFSREHSEAEQSASINTGA